MGLRFGMVCKERTFVFEQPGMLPTMALEIFQNLLEYTVYASIESHRLRDLIPDGSLELAPVAEFKEYVQSVT
jgi:hypothetical protein